MTYGDVAHAYDSSTGPIRKQDVSRLSEELYRVRIEAKVSARGVCEISDVYPSWRWRALGYPGKSARQRAHVAMWISPLRPLMS